MVTRKKKAAARGGVKKLTLKRETLMDLDAKRKAEEVKGGSGHIACTPADRNRGV